MRNINHNSINKIKICLIIDRLDIAGGPRYFELLARGLDVGDFSVTIVSDPTSPLWNTLVDDGLTLAAAPFSHPFSSDTIRRLKHLFRENAFDIVHSMGLRADVHTRIAAAMCRPRPIVMSTVAMLAHGFDVGLLRRWAYEWAERWTGRFVDLFLTDSDYTRQSLISRNAFPASRVRTTRIGTNRVTEPSMVNRSGVRHSWAVPDDNILIASLGRLTQQKGHDIFLEAFAILRKKRPSLKAIVMGDGPLREDLAKRAAAADMEGCVRICPAGRDLENTLSAIDILVIASRSESIPLLLYDAMAMARPIVATAVGGIPEILEDGITGLIVPKEDPIALSAAIERLLATPVLADTMRRCARMRTLERYTTENCVRETQNIYRDLMGGAT